MKLNELQIGSTATILSVGGGGRSAPTFSGYGIDTRHRSDGCTICTDGRSN